MAVLLFSSLASANEAAAILLSLDNEDGVYARGQDARLSIQIAPHIVAEEGWIGEVSWQRNWNPAEGHQSFAIESASQEMIFGNEEPGLVVVRVVLKKEGVDKPVHSESIGMLFQPESISLATAEPDDFDAFWEEQKVKWRSLVTEVTLTAVDSPDPEVEVWDVQILLADETPVSGYVARSVGARDGTLPAILNLHGAGFRSSNIGAVVQFARMGFLAMDINAHGFPNGREAGFYQEQAERISRFRLDHVTSREQWYFKGMYLRVVIAMDYLMAREEWNGEDLVLHGSSQGGVQVFAGAGLNPRVSVIAASVPAMCDMSGALVGRRGGWARTLPERYSNEARAQHVHDTFGYYDSGIFAKRIHAEAIVSLGLIDSTCSSDGIQAAINNLRGEVTPLYRPQMRHAFPREIQLDFLNFIRERVNFPE